MEIHNIIAAKVNIPGQTRFERSVATIANIIDTSTRRSQKMSNIPPKIVGASIRATDPSKVSIKNEIIVKIRDNMIRVIDSSV
jgi:hypothetical protein